MEVEGIELKQDSLYRRNHLRIRCLQIKGKRSKDGKGRINPPQLI